MDWGKPVVGASGLLQQKSLLHLSVLLRVAPQQRDISNRDFHNTKLLNLSCDSILIYFHSLISSLSLSIHSLDKMTRSSIVDSDDQRRVARAAQEYLSLVDTARFRTIRKQAELRNIDRHTLGRYIKIYRRAREEGIRKPVLPALKPNHGGRNRLLSNEAELAIISFIETLERGLVPASITTIEEAVNTIRKRMDPTARPASQLWIRHLITIFFTYFLIQAWLRKFNAKSFELSPSFRGFKLEEWFDTERNGMPGTTRRQPERPAIYRMLLSDGYFSHLELPFIEFCAEYEIIPFCFPPHLTHLIQPLDVSVFGVFKHQHKISIENNVRHGNLDFSLFDFLEVFQSFHRESFSYHTILSGWRATGLDPK